MADRSTDDVGSKSETSVTDGRTQSFLKIKLRSMVRSCKGKTSTVNTEKMCMSDKERMKRYRKRIKKNPALYQSYRELNNARNRAYRANLSETKKAEQREQTPIRVQKWRQEKARKITEKCVEPSNQKPKFKPKTRHQSQKLKDQWRLSKQKQRAAMTAQKKRRVNEKRREKYAEKKKLKENISRTVECKESSENQDSLLNTGYTSKEAERKAVYRAKQSIPSSPGKYAKVLTTLAAKATPRKRKALESERMIYLTPTKKKCLDLYDENMNKICKEMHDTRMNRSRVRLQRRLLAKVMPWGKSSGCSLTNEISKCGVSWRFVSKASEVEGVWDEKKRQDGLDDETIDKIESFYKTPGVSACLPDKKLVQSKTMQPRHVMEQSLQLSYKQFKSKTLNVRLDSANPQLLDQSV